MTKKILIIRSSSMGDIVHALPVAYDIKKAYPDARIDWVVEESFRDIPTLSPFVDRCVFTAFRRWRKSLFSAKTRNEIGALRQALRQEKYDIVIDLQGLVRSAMVARWARSHSIGYSRDTIREPLASFMYDETRRMPESLTAVRRYRMMAADCLGYEIDDKKPRFGLKTVAPMPVQIEGAYAAFAVNTSRDDKLWPEDRWVEIGCRLINEGIRSVLFWGNEKERECVTRIASYIPNAMVLPKLNLAQCATVLQGAKAAFGVDTGLAHLGAALAVPSVGIIVSTPAAWIGLVSEGPCKTVGDKGVVPSVDDVWNAYKEVTA